MARKPGSELSNRQFVLRVARRLEAAFAEHPDRPRISKRMSMLQIAFGRPAIHYEVWIQRGRQQIELGLHLEAAAKLNGRIMRYLAEDMPALRHSLGDDLELEQWTQSWGRIHQHLPLGRVDDARVEDVAAKSLAFIEAVQPRLEACLAQDGDSA